MNGWRSRVLLAALMLLTMQIHAAVMADVPNTDGGMLQFHLSAAVVDLFLLYCAPRFTAGRLCGDMQTLCLVSIVANFVGWIAYMAYAPPIFYNTFMWGLSYVQWARLLLVDRHGDDCLGLYLVRGANRGWRQTYFGA